MYCAHFFVSLQAEIKTICVTTMIKKGFLLLFAVVWFAQFAVAANGLWLVKKDGSMIGYLFDQNVSIRYTSTSIYVSSPEATVEYPFDDVRKVYFDEGVTGIDEAVLAKVEQQVRLTSNGVDIKGFAAGTPVTMVNLAGQVVMRRTTDAQGCLFISKGELSQGIYIIKVDKTSIKFNNK